MSGQNFEQAYPQKRESNGWGLAGFIVSLLGLPTCGLLSPIGLLLSLIGIFKRPKGFAIAGLVIGLLGSLWLAMMGASMVAAWMNPEIKGAIMTGVSMTQAVQRINQYSTEHNDATPGDKEGAKLLEDLKDGFDHPYSYKKTGPNKFELRSAGPDGNLNTKDDMVMSEQGQMHMHQP